VLGDRTGRLFDTRNDALYGIEFALRQDDGNAALGGVQVTA